MLVARMMTILSQELPFFHIECSEVRNSVLLVCNRIASQISGSQYCQQHLVSCPKGNFQVVLHICTKQ